MVPRVPSLNDRSVVIEWTHYNGKMKWIVDLSMVLHRCIRQTFCFIRDIGFGSVPLASYSLSTPIVSCNANSLDQVDGVIQVFAVDTLLINNADFGNVPTVDSCQWC